MMSIPFALRQRLQRLPVPYQHKLPMLSVAGAARPACHIEYRIYHLLRYGPRSKLAYRPQTAQQRNNFLRMFAMYPLHAPDVLICNVRI